SRTAKPTLELVRTREEWNRVWATHLGTADDDAYGTKMDVDFERCMVIAVFRGERVNARGIQIDSTTEAGESIRIRLSDLRYQTAGKANKDPPDRPYAFIVVAKSSKGIVAEENLQHYKGQPPEWKEWLRADSRGAG